MKVEISPWIHVETSFTVRDANMVGPGVSVPYQNDDNDHGINKEPHLSNRKTLRQGRSSTKTMPSVTMESTPTTALVVPSSTSMHNDVAVEFIEHTKSSLSYYHHLSASRNRNSTNSSRKRRKLSSNSKRITQNYSEEELYKEDRIPVLTVSSQNHVAVMVEEEEDLLEDNQQRIQESALLQFHQSRSRGDSDTSKNTLTSKNSTNADTMTTTIPPVYDVYSQRMYAVECQNTKIICHYKTNTATSTNDDGNTKSSNEFNHHEPRSMTCEVTVPCGIQSLSILHLPSNTEASSHKKNAKNPNGRSILYGTTCSDSKLFIVLTQPVTTTIHHHTTPSKPSPKLLQLVIQYFDTPSTASMTTEIATSHQLQQQQKDVTPTRNATNQPTSIPQHQQHVGTLAVVCSSVNSATSGNTSGISTPKKRSWGTHEGPTTNIQSDRCIVCFYQVFSTKSNVQVARQHLRFLHEPATALSTAMASTTIDAQQSIPAMIYCSLYSDEKHTNRVTPIYLRNEYPIEDLKVLGTTPCSESEDGNSTSIVLSYRSESQASSTGTSDSSLATGMVEHEMNGSSTHLQPTKAPRRYNYFYTCLSASPRRVVSSSLSSFPFILPFTDDEIQDTCLVGTSMIGVLTQRYKQVYLYDLHRGGLIHSAQPFPTSIINTLNRDIPVTCTSLLADTKRSKIAVTYIAPGSPNKYCIAYASVGLNSGNNRFPKELGPISLADGLVAAASTISYGAQLHSMIPTRTLHSDVHKLHDNDQREMMIPRQAAILKGAFFKLKRPEFHCIQSTQLTFNLSFYFVVR